MSAAKKGASSWLLGGYEKLLKMELSLLLEFCFAIGSWNLELVLDLIFHMYLNKLDQWKADSFNGIKEISHSKFRKVSIDG